MSLKCCVHTSCFSGYLLMRKNGLLCPFDIKSFLSDTSSYIIRYGTQDTNNCESEDDNMSLDRTLIDSNHTPTIDELKDYFHKHDWSAAQISDPDKRRMNILRKLKRSKSILTLFLRRSQKRWG